MLKPSPTKKRCHAKKFLNFFATVRFFKKKFLKRWKVRWRQQQRKNMSRRSMFV
ncbi:hypothetical protein LTSEADE_4623 [Salmonella enterica subsp. enterica serovar Adelaide str. A4-669]|uniref:Uncharacterized protein n=1 Tax=Salmonella enterica subsp. enterica serovar Adelaide str. A4-669 TaxID=913063 RepID=A0A6C8GH76_SALET|nr:hypothetical protein LTSEADE_4623 [Salmonella enterica subsp. enterica serovar Adelaide str. A4-669]